MFTANTAYNTLHYIRSKYVPPYFAVRRPVRRVVIVTIGALPIWLLLPLSRTHSPLVGPPAPLRVFAPFLRSLLFLSTTSMIRLVPKEITTALYRHICALHEFSFIYCCHPFIWHSCHQAIYYSIYSANPG
eukprot:6214202-Pleurochrysis_carterae.AAC.2